MLQINIVLKEITSRPINLGPLVKKSIKEAYL
jgi:hypothetical protein